MAKEPIKKGVDELVESLKKKGLVSSDFEMELKNLLNRRKKIENMQDTIIAHLRDKLKKCG
jgi:hypothetical protein